MGILVVRLSQPFAHLRSPWPRVVTLVPGKLELQKVMINIIIQNHNTRPHNPQPLHPPVPESSRHDGFRSSVCEVSPPPSRPAHLHRYQSSRLPTNPANIHQDPTRCDHRTQDGPLLPVPGPPVRGYPQCQWQQHLAHGEVARAEGKHDRSRGQQDGNSKYQIPVGRGSLRAPAKGERRGAGRL